MHPQASSEDFYKSVVKNVPLNKLYRVVRSSYFDEEAQHAPIVSEIVDVELKEMLGGKFLLEAWFEDKLLYRKPLEKDVRVLNSARPKNSLIYLPSREDTHGDGDWIHIVRLGLGSDGCGV